MKKISEQTKAYIDQFELSIQKGGQPLVPPLTASLQANKWCNSKCEYCGIWHNPKSNPPLDDMILAVNELSELGVKMISLTGGEPFLQDCLPQVINQMRSRGVISSTMTNGLLLSPNHIDPILEAGLTSLCVSLDTIDPDIYKRIRGVSIKPVLKGLEYVSRRRKDFPNLLLFSINCVISRLNIDHLLPLIEYCSGLGMSVGFQPLHYSFDSDYNSAELMFTESDLPHLYEQMEKIIKMGEDGFTVNNDAPYLMGFPDFLIYKRLPEGTKCTAGYSSISVDYKLNVRSCWPKKPLGNLHEAKLTDIWKSDLYSETRASMLELKCPKCWLRCHTDHLSVQWLADLHERMNKINSARITL